jgi:hypothetical protein
VCVSRWNVSRLGGSWAGKLNKNPRGEPGSARERPGAPGNVSSELVPGRFRAALGSPGHCFGPFSGLFRLGGPRASKLTKNAFPGAKKNVREYMPEACQASLNEAASARQMTCRRQRKLKTGRGRTPVWVFVCVCVCACACMHVCIYIRMNVCMFICLCVWMDVCTHTHTHANTHTHTHNTHTHTHTHSHTTNIYICIYIYTYIYICVSTYYIYICTCIRIDSYIRIHKHSNTHMLGIGPLDLKGSNKLN